MNKKKYIKSAQLCAAIQEQSDKKQLIVKQILEREVEADAKIAPNSSSVRPDENPIDHVVLRSALDHREIEIFNMLLAHGVDFTAKNENGETILHHALANSCYAYANCWKLKGRLKHPFIDSILLAHVNSDNYENCRNEHGLSYFHAACMTNNAKAVEFYLNHGISANEAVSADSKALAGYAPLHFAARYCCLETARTLLRFGANCHAKDANGITPLHMLIQRNMEIVDWMNMGKRAAYDRFIADFEDNEQMLELMLEGSYADWRIPDDGGLSRLQIACTIYDQSRIDEFLGELADVDRAVDANSPIWPGYTALHFAAHFNVETVKLLLKHGANVLAEDANGVSPFELCLQRYEAEDVCCLVASQPSWRCIVLSDDRTRLTELLLAMRSATALKSHLQASTDVNACVPMDSPLWPGYTALHLAATLPERTRDASELSASGEYSHGEGAERYYNCSQAREKLYLQRVQVCLQLGADATIQDARDSSALHRAFRLMRESAVDALLPRCATRNRTDDEGLSHLHIACAAQRRDAVAELLDERNVNEPAPSSLEWFVKPRSWESSSRRFRVDAGSTPLHIAVGCEDANLAGLLLRLGADARARDASGLTPVHRLLGVGSRDAMARRLLSTPDPRDCVAPGGLSHLHVASLAGLGEAAARLLDGGADVNARIEPTLPFLREYDGDTALHLAVESRQLDVAGRLVRRGADVLAENAAGSVPLYAALDSGYHELVGVFARALEREPALQRRLAADQGLTMLHIACATLDVDSARGLLDRGADANARVGADSPIWAGCAPLHLLSAPLSQEERAKVGALLELLLRRGADVTLANARGSSPIHRLHSLVDSYVDNHSHVDALLEAQRDYGLNPRSADGISHFHVACARDHVEVVGKFLASGRLDVDHAIDHFQGSFGGYTALHVAVYKGCHRTIELLLRHGAAVDAEDRHGNTPLHVAAERDDISTRLIERVVNGGADVRAVNVLGQTLLEILLTKWTDVPRATVELFLERGLRANAFNLISGEGLLAMAFSTSDAELRGVEKPAFEALAKAADLAALDPSGRNAIHNVVSTLQPRHRNSAEDYADAIEMLVGAGCDYDHQDDRGRSPLHLAFEFRQIEAITGLLRSGADVNVLDASGRPAFAYILKYLRKRLVHDRDIVANFAVHLRKMVLLGLDVDESNVEAVVAARKALPFNVKLDKEFDEQLDRLRERKINSTRVTLYDFLSETAAVSSYPYSTPQERLAMRELFQTQFESVRKEFPEVAGFLRLQYKKALARPPLISPAIASLRIILGFELPVLCSDVILKFLRNQDLKNLTAAADF